MRLPVPLEKAYRPMNHGPVVLVSSARGAARNVMAADGLRTLHNLSRGTFFATGETIEVSS